MPKTIVHTGWIFLAVWLAMLAVLVLGFETNYLAPSLFFCLTMASCTVATPPMQNA